MAEVEELLTVPEVAAYLGLSADAVYRLCRSNRLAHFRVGQKGGKILVRRRDARRYLRGCFVKSAMPKGQGSGRVLKHITV